jgi:hypothetical protein
LRRNLALLAVSALALVACGSASGRDLTTYYDPVGLFSTRLPAANAITVTPPQPAATGPGLLTGVIAAPPQPSPTPASAVGGGSSLIGPQTAASDQTIYEAFAFTTDTFPSLDDMALTLLTGDPSIDVDAEEDVRFAGRPGRLVVATAEQDGTPTASIAAVMTLGTDGTGYLLAAIFPPGAWEGERDDFLEIARSFEPSVPPGISSFDLSPTGA